MVGFDPTNKDTLSKLEHGSAGAFSGIVTRGLLQPLDVVKVRFQLQVEPLSKTSVDSKYWSVTQAFTRIIKEEGGFALWKGHVPAQLLSFVYGGVQFLSFEVLTQKTWHFLPQSRTDKKKPLVHFVCGAGAGSLATVFAYPFDTIRTRLIAQGEPKEYRNIFEAIVKIFTREGTRAFYKGLSPSLLQIAPHTGAQFAFYELITEMWQNWGQRADDKTPTINRTTVIGSLVCGSLAGICAKTIVYPLDLAKKRMQIQGFEYARKGFGKVSSHKGLLECLWLTVQNESFTSLYKGLSPSMLKAGAATAIHFTVYEQACLAIASLHR